MMKIRLIIVSIKFGQSICTKEKQLMQTISKKYKVNQIIFRENRKGLKSKDKCPDELIIVS